MIITETAGHEQLHRLAEKFFTAVAEQLLEGGVNQLDYSSFVNDHETRWGRFENQTKLLFHRLARLGSRKRPACPLARRRAGSSGLLGRTIVSHVIPQGSNPRPVVGRLAGSMYVEIERLGRVENQKYLVGEGINFLN